MNANSIWKRLFIGSTSIALLMLSPAAQADPPKKDQLPPGLAKKDKLPPGWQKKMANKGQNGTNVTVAPAASTPAPAASTPPTPPTSTPPPPPPTSGSVSTPPTTPPTTPTTPTRPLTREQQERYARLDNAVARLEAQAARPGAADRLILRLARVTDIPQAKLREQWNAHPGVSVGQFYVATAIAVRKRISVAPVLAERKSGKSWGEIADEYKVKIGDLVEGLQGAEAAARNAAQETERKAQQVAK